MLSRHREPKIVIQGNAAPKANRVFPQELFISKLLGID